MKYQLLKIIVCPLCHASLFFNLNQKELICNIDSLAFPIKKGIPILIKKQARKIILLK